MATTLPTLTDPDKFGLLINLRQKIDELKPDKLYTYSQSILKLLSVKQLKKFLFVGLNAIKTDIEYMQLSQMKSSINKIIEQEKKSKKKCKSAKDTDSKSNPTIPIIPKNASLTKVIPFDIISNYICHFLKMSSITKLAECDRKLAVICHTPTSIKNLMHRYDPYPYIDYSDHYVSADGHYYNMNNWTVQTMHRFKNVEQLSISWGFFKDGKVEMFNSLNKTKNLSICWSEENHSIVFNQIQMIPFLETFSVVQNCEIYRFLGFVDKYLSKHKLKSIAIIDDALCSLVEAGFNPIDDPELYKQYKNMTDFLLPPQPNNLEILKFEQSYFMKSNETECKEANTEYGNIERIKESLTHLRGFVYSQPITENDSIFLNDDIYYVLSHTILSNLILFKKIESLHTHCHELIQLYLNNNSISAMQDISELCISVDFSETAPTSMNSLFRQMRNLQNVCLVINVNDSVTTNLSQYETLFKSIFSLRNLRLFQIVTVFSETQLQNTNTKLCAQKTEIVTELMKKLLDVFNAIQNYYNYATNYKTKPLLFKFHIKACHPETNIKCEPKNMETKSFGNAIQHMILNYLMTYHFGKIQIKCSHNVYGSRWIHNSHYCITGDLHRYLKGLDGLFTVSVKSGGNLTHLSDDKPVDRCCYADMDFKQYAISVTKLKQNISDDNIEYERKWKVDCRYCCNTPWV